MNTNINAYDYALPEDRIAHNSVSPKDASKLLVLDRQTGRIQHTVFSEISGMLKKGDVLVMNDTRVFKARIFGKKKDGAVKVEMIVLRATEKGLWEVMLYPGRRMHIGTVITFEDGIQATVKKKTHTGVSYVQFSCSNDEVFQYCERYGSTPLPPYVDGADIHDDDYQTVYAKKMGSVAAPTSGFHFTERLIKELRDMGVVITYVTLHIGIGTFQPVKSEVLEEHPMHTESVHISSETADIIATAKAEGRRVIAVGTTATRALEGAAPIPQEGFSGDVDIFITPGYTFQVIDGLITNFHLPKTTLLALVTTFGGYDAVMNAYQIAIEKQYRFYSFGDAMMIV